MIVAADHEAEHSNVLPVKLECFFPNDFKKKNNFSLRFFISYS